MNPQFKYIFTPIIELDKKIQIGREDGNLELDDPDGNVKKLLELMDGKQSLEEISLQLNTDPHDFMDILEDLNEFGLIEDSKALQRTALSKTELERYRSNLNYFSNFSDLQHSRYSYQEKLKQASVAVLGLGGFSLTAAALAGMGIGKIVGLDYDTVELSNLNRQFLYSEDDIGHLKTTASLNRLKKINSEIDVEVHNLKVENAHCLSEIIEKTDIVINGIDQPSIVSTRWVNYACVKNDKPYLLGGIGHTSILLQKYLPGHESGCFDCYLLKSMMESPVFEYQLRAVYGASFQKRNTAFAPNIAMITGLITNELAKKIGGYGEIESISSSLEISSLSFEVLSNTKWTKLEECPTCGIHSNKETEPVDLEELIMIAKQESRVG